MAVLAKHTEHAEHADKLGGAFGAMAFLRLAGRCRIMCVYLLLLVDQILQTGLDWFLLIAAVQIGQTRSLLSFHWQFITCWINLLLKLALARAAASCCTAAGNAFHLKWLEERVMKGSVASAETVMDDMKVVDVGLSHQVWVILAMLCSSLGLLCLVHVRLPQPVYGLLLALPAYLVLCWCLFESFHQRTDQHKKLCVVRKSAIQALHSTFAPGAAARLMAKASHR